MKDLKKIIKNKNCFIFDMDGTMLDLEQLNFHGAENTLEDKFDIDITFKEYRQFIAGTRIKEAIKEILKHEGVKDEDFDEGKLINTFREYKRQHLLNNIEDNVKVKPGLIEFLNYLKKLNKKLAVATSSHAKFVKFLFKAFNLTNYFEVIITADDVTKTKPDPEPFLLAMKELECDEENTVIFEDSFAGLTAAKKTGAFVIAFHTPGMNDKYLNLADAVIKNYVDLIM